MKTNTTTKAILLLILTIAISPISLASSDKTVIKNYTIKAFSTLKVSSAFKVEFIHSNENKVSVEIDEDEADHLYVGTSENELTIKLKDCMNCRTHVLKATVYGNSLSEIFISGASSFTSTYTFTEKKMNIKSSGASKIEISLNTENLGADVSGASKITVKGKATTQEIDASGASNYNGKECKNNNSNITASGASKITIDCADTLHAEASGASSIKYISKPKTVNQDISGASNISLD